MPVSRRPILGVVNNDHLLCKRPDIQPLDGQCEKDHRDSLLGTAPRVSTACTICLPDDIAHSQISQALNSQLYLHTANDQIQILAVEMARERGYLTYILTPCTLVSGDIRLVSRAHRATKGGKRACNFP